MGDEADGDRFFDVSKQVLGSTMVHVLNVLLSLLSSGSFSIDPPLKHPKRGGESTNGDGDDKKGLNPCSFYLLNLLIDVCLPPLHPMGPANDLIDNPRHPHPHLHPPPHHPPPPPHQLPFPHNRHPIRLLRLSPALLLVAQAIHHLLLWPNRHEARRLPHLHHLPLSRQGRRLDAFLDGG